MPPGSNPGFPSKNNKTMATPNELIKITTEKASDNELKETIKNIERFKNMAFDRHTHFLLDSLVTINQEELNLRKQAIIDAAKIKADAEHEAQFKEEDYDPTKKPKVGKGKKKTSKTI